MTIKNSLVKLLMVGTVLASPSLEAGKSSYDPKYGILTVSRKKVEKLETGQITDQILTIKGQSFKVNGSISYLPCEPEAYIGLKGDQNTFSIKGIDLPGVGIDPETGLPLENQYMPPPFQYFSLTFELSDSPKSSPKITCPPTVEKSTPQSSDSPITVSKITCAPTVEKTTAQSSDSPITVSKITCAPTVEKTTAQSSDSPITVSKITCPPTVEKSTPQPSVQKASTSLPEQGDPSFFSAFDEKTKLWYGMECLTTKKAIDWWKKRLGIDTWFVCGASVQAFDSTPIPDAIRQAAQNSKYRLDPWTTVRKMISIPTEGHRAQDLQSRVDKEYNELMEGGYYHGKGSKKWANQSYEGAFEGFKANLDKASETFPIWVSYFSDTKLERPASEVLNPEDPAIKISMTAILDHKFYTPLGIYVNPIARELDGEAKTPHPQISVPLHRQLVRHVQGITPESKHMILRPLPSMTQAMTKAGVQFASFSGFEIEPQKGVQLEFTGNFGGWNGTSISYQFTTEDGTVYAPNWFTSHDFIGAVNNPESLKTLPFVVANIEDLKN